VELGVELGGLEPPTPCLQSDVFVCCGHADLVKQLSVSAREVPLVTMLNGTLMAR
jgi:hypothetical protein